MDETALEASAGIEATDGTDIDINNVKGADSIDDMVDGKPLATNVKYGEAKAGICNIDNPHDTIAVTGKPEGVLWDADYWCEPATSFATPLYGEYPGANSSGGSQGTSELNVLDYLAILNNHHVVREGHLLTFNTVLAAIETARMRDQFAKSSLDISSWRPPTRRSPHCPRTNLTPSSPILRR